MSELSDLYQQTILQHNKNPFHYARQDDADVVLEAYNPLCGDKFKLYLNLDGEVIKEAHFHGYGCAISKASTSVLTKRMEGQPVSEILELCRQYLASLEQENETLADDEELSAFGAARQFPGRLKCASLSWDALLEYLEKNKA